MRVTILTRDGSFGILAQRLKKLLPFDVTVTDWQKLTTSGPIADVVIVLWWRAIEKSLPRVPLRSGAIGAVFDSWSWKITAEASEAFRRAMNHVDLLVVGTEQIASELRNHIGSLPPVFICETGADLETFQPAPFPSEFCAMWCGNSLASDRNLDLKGVGIVKEACSMAGIPLHVADISGEHGSRLDHDHMASWYKNGSCLVIASQSEGTPRPLLEAMACGRPVVTTRVGLASRLVHHGINGCIVDRSSDAIAAGLRYVKKLVSLHPDRVQSSARMSVTAWPESMMCAKWTEVVRALDGTPEKAWWTNGNMPSPKASRMDVRPPSAPNRADIEHMELRGNPCEPVALQPMIDAMEREGGISNDRPIVVIPSTYRFACRTMYLIEHMVSEFRFVVGNEKGDLAWCFYPFNGAKHARTNGMKYLLTMRGQFWHMAPDMISLAVESYEHASYITALSCSLYRDLTTLYPQLSPIRHSIIHNGSFINGVKKAPMPVTHHRRPIFLCVTNLSFPGKREAVEEMALALDKQRFPGTFLVVSQSPPRGTTVRLGRCGAYDGFQENRFGLYKSADLFLYPSWIDGQPTTVIEAMSAGMPVIASRAQHSGIDEFITHGETGLLYDMAEEGATLAMALLVRPQRYSKMAQLAQRWVEQNCSWKKSAEAYTKILKDMLGER
jgi:glycosyltransferase involved in cell wall biosynthesis